MKADISSSILWLYRIDPARGGGVYPYTASHPWLKLPLVVMNSHLLNVSEMRVKIYVEFASGLCL